MSTKDITDEDYIPHITGNGMAWIQDTNKLDWRDVRILGVDSLFETMDAKRNTGQHKKDFINDQDSTSGPGVVDNMIRNILTLRAGTFHSDTRFGIAVDSMLFETLDWANLEFVKTTIFNDLSTQLPQNITVTNIELSTNDTWDTLNIDVLYNIKIDGNKAIWQQPGPDTIGERIAAVTLNLKGVRGSNQNSFTNQ